MRRLVLIVAAAAVASGCSVSEADPPLAAERRLPEPPADARAARVERVVDGDTIVLSGIGKARLIGVDTPEVFGGVECFGREASAFAERLLDRASVDVASQAERRDRYGRALVDVWLPDGRFFNAMLVARGYAKPLRIAPNARYAGLLVRLARDARSAGRGLWGRAACGRP